MNTVIRYLLALVAGSLAVALVSGCSLFQVESEPVASPAPPPEAEAAPTETALVAPSRLLDRLDPPTEPASPEPALAPADDLVARLRAAFVLPDRDDEAVERELAWYASHPDYIERVLDRGSRYLYHIADELEAREMPADIALLPIVESAFDPFAYSRGRASGLWQIIPGTGDMLGLKQNWWYDGRRDVVDSTRAALDYLEQLHRRFDGDWLLAIAGYNSGEGHVARALEQARKDGRPTDFWSIRNDLRAETASYVPKLLALRKLVAEPARFDIELPVIDNTPYFAIVETGGQIDMAVAAEISGLGVDVLYSLNPGVNRWATDPEGPHRLIVPAAGAGEIEAALSDLDRSEQVRWSRHEIGGGETLSQIAERYGTTIELIREINDIQGSLIRAGDHLMIPHASAAADRYSMSVDARLTRQQDRDRDGNRIDYMVRAGDSLWSIAQRFQVGTDALASWNAMAPGDVLSVGRLLVIWTDDPVTVMRTSLEGPAAVRRVEYVVRSGDSLAAIAGRFRVTIAELVGWNGIDPERYLQPGQNLILYVDVTAQST